MVDGVPDGAKISDDGFYWWDGTDWQPVPGATGAVADAFDRAWGAEIARLRQMFVEHHYACWCGPGHVCNEDQDPMDTCCHHHDDAYEAAGVTSDDPPPAGTIGMWTVAGIKATIAADATLVACVTATEFDAHFYGPEAALYRAGVQLIFGTRATIASWLISNGY